MDKLIPKDVQASLRKGTVIPALPLALNRKRKLDERRQRALIRYYLDAGAGGIAVAVHTTQFAIRLPEVNLYNSLLEITKEEFDRFTGKTKKPVIRIAGVIGKTEQALKEAQTALKNGFHCVLLSLAAFKDSPNNTIIKHCKTIAEVIPLFGFYLQPAVGGRILDVDFWREFAGIKNVIAIKIAPFNRYQTLDVLEAVAHSGRSDEIALYTGNDDNIIIDLLTRQDFNVEGRTVSLQIVGGLLGQWACWTKTAVEHLERINTIRKNQTAVPHDMLSLASQMTLANKAIFDADNHFSGCIPGISYVLKSQGLLKEVRSLDPEEQLSLGQEKLIDRIIRDYPHLTDDIFVQENLEEWSKD